MVEPLRSLTMSTNNLVANTMTHTQQVQELFFQLKSLLVAAGGTILRSNGGGVASAADNINTAADVTMGIAGTGAWFVINFANLGGGGITCSVTLLFYMNDASAPYQTVTHQAGNATYIGGSTSALPTLDTGFVYPAKSFSIHCFTDIRNLRWTSWRSTNVDGAQSIRFLMKEDGSLSLTGSNSCVIFDIEGNSDASGGGVGTNRWWIYGANVATMANLTGGTGIGLVNPNGVAAQTFTGVSVLAVLAQSWTNGLDSVSRQNLAPVLCGVSSAEGRLLGIWADLFGTGLSAGSGIWADADESGQILRRKNVGQLVVYWPDGEDL